VKAPQRYQCLDAVLEPVGLADVYPGHGFFPTAYFELGNGDRHGLYWPIGKETQAPIVCEMFHDEWTLDPHSSCPEGFLRHVAETRDLEEDEWHREAWSGLCRALDRTETAIREWDDDRSPSRLFARARESLARRDVGACIAALETALDVLPEYGLASALLATQYLRQGRMLEAAQAAIQCTTSPPMFGGEVPSALLKIRGLEGTALDEDPIWKNRFRLAGSRAETENETYRVMEECIAAYLDRGLGAAAVRLRTTWGQRMAQETHSFRERHGCVGDWWPTRLKTDLAAAGLSERLGDFEDVP
jgi:hypothetical protein